MSFQWDKVLQCSLIVSPLNKPLQVRGKSSLIILSPSPVSTSHLSCLCYGPALYLTTISWTFSFAGWGQHLMPLGSREQVLFLLWINKYLSQVISRRNTWNTVTYKLHPRITRIPLDTTHDTGLHRKWKIRKWLTCSDTCTTNSGS